MGLFLNRKKLEERLPAAQSKLNSAKTDLDDALKNENPYDSGRREIREAVAKRNTALHELEELQEKIELCIQTEVQYEMDELQKLHSWLGGE